MAAFRCWFSSAASHLTALAACIAITSGARAQHLEFPQQVYYECATSTQDEPIFYFDRSDSRPSPTRRRVPNGSVAIADIDQAIVQLSGEARTATASEENRSLTGSIGVAYSSTALQSTFISRIGIAATGDAITENFGSSILTPGQGGALNSGYLQYNSDKGWG